MDDLEKQVSYEHSNNGCIVNKNIVPKNNEDVGGVSENTDVTCVHETSISPRFRAAKTCCMFMVYIGLGCCLGVAYATVVDMVEYYHTAYDSVTDAQMVKAIGLMSGFIFGSPIADRFRRRLDFFLFIFSLIFGLSCAAIPWSPNLFVMGFLFIVSGLSHSTLDICCVTICIAMWGKKAPAPIFGLYTCMAIGTTVSPLITAPFLSKPISDNTTNGTGYIDSGELSGWMVQLPHFGNEDIYNSTMTPTQMKIPYAIFGVWSIFIGLVFLLFFIGGMGYPSKPAKERKPLKDILHPASCAGGSTGFGIYFVAALFISYCFINGRDRGFGMFLFTIANKGIDTDKTTSALILFSYNATGSIARAFCAFISIWIPIQIIVMVLVCGAVALQAVIVFYGLDSALYLWILSCAMAVFVAPMYPSLMAWADIYIEMNGVVMGIVNIGIGVGGLSGMFLSGYIFQQFKSLAVLKLALLYGIGLAVTYIPLQIISHIRGNRHKKTEQVLNQTVDDVVSVEQNHGVQAAENDTEPLID